MKLKLIALITTNGIVICRAVSLLTRGLWVKVVFKKCLTLRTDDFLAALMVNNTIPIKYKYHVGLIASGASLLGKDEISSIGGRTSPGVRCHTIVTVTAYSTFWEMEMIVFSHIYKPIVSYLSKLDESTYYKGEVTWDRRKPPNLNFFVQHVPVRHLLSSMEILYHVLLLSCKRPIRDYPESIICFEFTIILNLEDCVSEFVVAEKTRK